VRVKEDCVIADMEEAVEFLKLLGLDFVVLKGDGEVARVGDCVLIIKGQRPDLLKVERVVLNVLMRASGIATMTRRTPDKARRVNPNVRVAATRKTTPFLRYLEKKAVAVGGGDPHRFSLSDAVLIKDNHIKAVGSLEKAIILARERAPFTAKIEVEDENAEEAVRAAEPGADIIMLDNMSPGDMAKAHEELMRRGLRDRAALEASGRINEDNAMEYARHVDASRRANT